MSEDIHEAAARWHVAQQHDDMDWEGFATWLEADPRHRRAYDDIALLDARIDAARPALIEAAATPAEVAHIDVPAAPGHRLPRWIPGLGIATAAAIALAVGIGFEMREPASPGPQTFVSATGTTRAVQLDRGMTVTLGSGSSLRVQSSGDRLQLAGSAYFKIPHDPGRTVMIEVDGYRIRDVGTRFAVNAAKGALAVSVEEGGVALRAPGQANEIRVTAGQEALAADGGIELRRVRPEAIASWRTGRFVYDEVPLVLVAADIERYTGQPVALAPSAARRRFSGVLATGDREAMIATLAQLTGLHADNDGRTIRLVDSAGR